MRIDEYDEKLWTACKQAGRVFLEVRRVVYKGGAIHPGVAEPQIQAIVEKAVARYGPEIEVPLRQLLNPSLKDHPYGMEDIAYEIWRHLPYKERYRPNDINSIKGIQAQGGIDAIMDEEVPGYEILLDAKFLAWIQVEAALTESKARKLIDNLRTPS